MPTSDYTVRALPQRLGERSLGRHVEHDPRSALYAFKAPSANLITTTHTRNVAIFDQGQLGSCTGNAMAGVLGTDPFFSTLPKGTVIDEKAAVSLYGDATKLDTIAGTYPPNDTGSTGLAVAKAAKARGLISGYTHTFTLNTALQALVAGPVIVGTNWYSSMDNPDDQGVVTIAAGAQIEGGHEYELYGLDVEKQLVWAANSWGPSWGQRGRFAMSFDTLQRLLSEDGDVIVPVAVTAPAPVPAPAPAPPAPAPAPVPVIITDADRALDAAIATWRKAKGL